MLPPAVQDFLDMSFNPDLDGYEADTSINTNDDNDHSRSSTPVMTLSDDILLDPAYWTSDRCRRVQAWLIDFQSAIQFSVATGSAPLAPKNEPSSITEPDSDLETALSARPVPPPSKIDPSSVTEPESDIENLPQLPIKKPTTTNDPSSVTEPESDIENLPQLPIKRPTTINDPSSVMEPESDIENLPQLPIKRPTTINDPSSITEPESDVEDACGMTPVPILRQIKWKSFFNTPSPPGPDSFYWKYVSWEEDAKWYDRSGTDASFRAVRQMKEELHNRCIRDSS
ncbi:hypothetical protein BD769DRAFT_1666366 [Suillus cothurnatus]|nr:hypothetical protein BD769DRAFT_1666366 [Suillus cothurnatus]